MGKFIDLTGQRFGKLIVVGNPKKVNGRIEWECRCDCGTTLSVTSGNLMCGNTKSCGCVKEREFIGERYCRLTVIGIAFTKMRRKYLTCKCDCGNETILNSANWGKTKSCGCLPKELHTTHGLHFTRLNKVWQSMKRRCFNKNDKNYNGYGGRGITVCDEWRNDFQAFYDWAMANGYDENAPHGECTIDRINNNGNYEPNNCRWVSMEFQAQNTRKNRFLVYNGETFTITQMARKYKIDIATLHYRLKKGMTVAEAIETPVKRS